MLGDFHQRLRHETTIGLAINYGNARPPDVVCYSPVLRFGRTWPTSRTLWTSDRFVWTPWCRANVRCSRRVDEIDREKRERRELAMGYRVRDVRRVIISGGCGGLRGKRDRRRVIFVTAVKVETVCDDNARRPPVVLKTGGTIPGDSKLLTAGARAEMYRLGITILILCNKWARPPRPFCVIQWVWKTILEFRIYSISNNENMYQY